MKKNKTEMQQTNIEHKDAADVATQLMAELGELGDSLAQREGYEQVSGLEAVWYYLIQKYHWQPKKVREMRLNDIYFCLKEEKF